jgi:nucleoside-diphosphate-sugar epimerase
MKLVSLSEQVLVTGATGFTGRLLVQRLRDDGYDVIAPSHGSTDPGAMNVDFCDFDRLTEFFSTIQPNVVVHLAGIAAPYHHKIDEIYRANVVGTGNLFVALSARKHKPRLIIVASSAQVYDTASASEPLTEDTPLAPKSHYAVSKRATEDIASIYANEFSVVVTRPFNYTGPGQSDEFIVPKIVQHYAKRRPEIRVGSLDRFRDFSDIRRVVEVYARLISRSVEPATVNICSGRTVYLGDIFKIMEDVSGHTLNIVTEPSFFRNDDPRIIVGSPLRLDSAVGPLPNPPFRETLTRMYEACMQEAVKSGELLS